MTASCRTSVRKQLATNLAYSTETTAATEACHGGAIVRRGAEVVVGMHRIDVLLFCAPHYYSRSLCNYAAELGLIYRSFGAVSSALSRRLVA